jgi:hypothetical protein
MRDRRLQGIEAIVQWQQRVPPECDHHRLLGLGQHGGTRLGLHIPDRRPLTPLHHGFRIDTELPAQLRERSLPLSSLQAAIAGQRIAVLLL